MKIYYLLSLSILILISCDYSKKTIDENNKYDIRISYNHYKIDKRNSKNYLNKKYLRDGNLYLIFEENFNKDTINIEINNNFLENRIITTESSTGVATEFKFENIELIETIGIRINNGKKIFLEIDTMNFFLFEYKKNIVAVTVPKSVPFYD